MMTTLVGQGIGKAAATGRPWREEVWHERDRVEQDRIAWQGRWFASSQPAVDVGHRAGAWWMRRGRKRQTDTSHSGAAATAHYADRPAAAGRPASHHQHLSGAYPRIRWYRRHHR